MDLGLTGKKAVVMAATRGLGNAIGRLLVEEGAEVLFVGRDQARLDQIAAMSPRAHTLALDLSASDAPDRLAQAAVKTLGQVDILVNNTGGPPPTPALGQSPELWREQFEAMVMPVIRTTDLLAPDMAERGWGRVLTVTSTGVVQPIANLAISNALRSSLVGWNKTLSEELAGKGVTANILIPGRINTDRVRGMDIKMAERAGISVEDAKARAAAAIPAKRYGEAEEFAAAAAFLASDRAAYITGVCLPVDGGLIRSV